jgi:hypothetical protein
VNEKRIRDAAALGALHGIVFKDEVERTTDRPPQFDGGVRGDALNARAVRERRPTGNRAAGTRSSSRTVPTCSSGSWASGKRLLAQPGGFEGFGLRHCLRLDRVELRLGDRPRVEELLGLGDLGG